MTSEMLTLLRLQETAGLSRLRDPVRQGLPFPRGLVADVKELVAIDEHGQAIPAQFDVLARWPDRSVKWMVVDALIDVAPHETTTIRIARAPASTVPQTASRPSSGNRVTFADHGGDRERGSCRSELPANSRQRTSCRRNCTVVDAARLAILATAAAPSRSC